MSNVIVVPTVNIASLKGKTSLKVKTDFERVESNSPKKHVQIVPVQTQNYTIWTTDTISIIL